MRRNIQRKIQIIIKYIQENIKEITTIGIIFLIGIIFGNFGVCPLCEEKSTFGTVH